MPRLPALSVSNRKSDYGRSGSTVRCSRFAGRRKDGLHLDAAISQEWLDGFKDRSSRPHNIIRRHLQPGKALREAIFSLLHKPPSSCGFNRMTGRLSDLRIAVRTKGVSASQASISMVIKQAGYRRKKARVTLTSNDPQYQEKVDAIRAVLRNLEDDKAFFPIDEFGRFAVKPRSSSRYSAVWPARLFTIVTTTASNMLRRPSQLVWRSATCRSLRPPPGLLRSPRHLSAP